MSSASAVAFPLTADPTRAWLSSRHCEILAALQAAIERNEGLLLLTGDVGTGKTVLTQVLVRRLREQDVRVAELPYPDIEPVDLHRLLTEAYDLPKHAVDPRTFLPEFQGFLNDAWSCGQRVLLVVDEAQGLQPAVLAEIERLLDADPHAGPDRIGVFNLLLVRQTTREGVPHGPEQDVLAGRIKVRCTLEPLTGEDIAAYVRHHLTAGGLATDLFTADALDEILARSSGNPRLINMICQRTIRAASGAGAEAVDARLLRQSFDSVGLMVRAGLDRRSETAAAIAEPAPSASEPSPPRRRDLPRVAAMAAIGLVLGLGALLYLAGNQPRRETAAPVDTKPAGQIVRQPERAVPVPAAPPSATVTEPPSSSRPTTDGVPAAPPAGEPAALPKATERPAAAVTPTPPPPSHTPAVVRTEPPKPAAPAKSVAPLNLTPPPSDASRARDRSPEAPPRISERPASATRPVDTPRAVVAPRGRATDEPDPSAIIDWLFKDAPRRSD